MLLSILATYVLAVMSAVSGAECLGGICLGDTEEALVARLGPGEVSPEVSHCYRLEETGFHLSVGIDDEDPARPVASILVTSVPRCPEAPAVSLKASTSTCHGIGLGSSSSELEERKIPGQRREKPGYPWNDAPEDVILIDSYCGTERYCPQMLSYFSREGRIVGIAIWLPDC